MTQKRSRPKLSELTGTLIIGTQQFELTGRAVLVHARLAVSTEWLSKTPIAQAVVDLAYGRVGVRLIESQPTIEAEDDLGLWAPAAHGSQSKDSDPLV